jgi:apolipoprotein N-acyltransferase
VLLVSALWVACELGRARLLTGAPWLLLGYALVPDSTLVQAADLGGPYLLSFVIVMVNASLAELLRGAGDGRISRWSSWPESGAPPHAASSGANARAVLSTAAITLIAMYAYGVVRLRTPLPDTPPVPVTVVQGNNVVGARWVPGSYGKGLDEYLRLSFDAAQRTHPRVIVWPEAAVPVFLAREPQYRAEIGRMLSATGADLIVGAPHYEDLDAVLPQYFNSAFYLTGGGEVSSRYDKVHLMPFTEYFPLRTIEFLRRNFEQVRTFTPGRDASLLDTRLGKVAVAICFEADFPDLVRRRMRAGADVLINLSNDVWLGTFGQKQHLAMVTLRAVENRTWVIRATTTGISAVVDPFGRIRSRSDAFTEAVLDTQIVPMQVETLYKRFGDVFAYTCVAISFIALVLLGILPKGELVTVMRPAEVQR